MLEPSVSDVAEARSRVKRVRQARRPARRHRDETGAVGQGSDHLEVATHDQKKLERWLPHDAQSSLREPQPGAFHVPSFPRHCRRRRVLDDASGQVHARQATADNTLCVSQVRRRVVVLERGILGLAQVPDVNNRREVHGRLDLPYGSCLLNFQLFTVARPRRFRSAVARRSGRSNGWLVVAHDTEDRAGTKKRDSQWAGTVNIEPVRRVE